MRNADEADNKIGDFFSSLFFLLLFCWLVGRVQNKRDDAHERGIKIGRIGWDKNYFFSIKGFYGRTAYTRNELSWAELNSEQNRRQAQSPRTHPHPCTHTKGDYKILQPTICWAMPQCFRNCWQNENLNRTGFGLPEVAHTLQREREKKKRDLFAAHPAVAARKTTSNARTSENTKQKNCP